MALEGLVDKKQEDTVKVRKAFKMTALVTVLIVIILFNIKILLMMDKYTDQIEMKNDRIETIPLRGVENQLVEGEHYGVDYFKPLTIQTSSEVKGYGNVDYSAENLIDMNSSSACIFDIEKEQGYIHIEFKDEVELDGIEILNGYCKSQEIYKRNSRVGKIEIELDHTYSIAVELVDEYNRFQKIGFGKSIKVSAINIRINDIVKGTQLDSPAMSEIRFYKEQ